MKEKKKLRGNLKMEVFFLDKNLEKLLCDLEADIDKKCFEIKEKRAERKLQILLAIGIILLLTIPSTLIIIGINIIGTIIGIISFMSISMIIMLPIVLKDEKRGICYE